MKLIIGLGNPGKYYMKTRHNVGEWVLDQVYRANFCSKVGKKSLLDYQITLLSDERRGRRLAKRTSDNRVAFTKSLVLMNQSGKFVKKLVQRYEIPLDDLLIMHDDLDVALGEFKMQKDRGAAGHKGVESIIASLESKDFWRLRIGIGRPPERVEAEEYVLENFDDEELEEIEGLIPEIVDAIKNWVISK